MNLHGVERSHGPTGPAVGTAQRPADRRDCGSAERRGPVVGAILGRGRELLAELVEVVDDVRAVPHLIEKNAELELRILRLEEDRDRLERDLACANDVIAELYLAPPRADAEVPDA